MNLVPLITLDYHLAGDQCANASFLGQMTRLQYMVHQCVLQDAEDTACMFYLFSLLSAWWLLMFFDGHGLHSTWPASLPPCRLRWERDVP